MWIKSKIEELKVGSIFRKKGDIYIITDYTKSIIATLLVPIIEQSYCFDGTYDFQPDEHQHYLINNIEYHEAMDSEEDIELQLEKLGWCDGIKNFFISKNEFNMNVELYIPKIEQTIGINKKSTVYDFS